VCHNWVPILFGPKREAIAGDQSVLVSEERYDLYCWPNIIWVIKLWGMWHKLCGGRREMSAGFWWGNWKEIDHLLDLGVYGRII
jgi:hypothetical protein